MVTELRAAGYASKLFAADGGAATARELVAAATSGRTRSRNQEGSCPKSSDLKLTISPSESFE